LRPRLSSVAYASRASGLANCHWQFSLLRHACLPFHHSRSSACNTAVPVLPAKQVCPVSTRNLSNHPPLKLLNPLNNLVKTAGILTFQSVFVHYSIRFYK